MRRHCFSDAILAPFTTFVTQKKNMSVNSACAIIELEPFDLSNGIKQECIELIDQNENENLHHEFVAVDEINDSDSVMKCESEDFSADVLTNENCESSHSSENPCMLETGSIVPDEVHEGERTLIQPNYHHVDVIWTLPIYRAMRSEYRDDKWIYTESYDFIGEQVLHDEQQQEIIVPFYKVTIDKRVFNVSK